MKKLVLIVAVLMVVAAPAWASVNITCAQVPGTKMVTVSYAVSEPNKVRGFALDITVDSGAKIIDVNEAFLNASYNIYPGSIVITGNEITDYGTPVANPYDPCTLPGQTQPGLGSGGITIEMGSLYYPTGDNSPNSPNYPGAAPWTGDLLRFEVDKDCCVTITENTVRGGVVLTNGSHPVVTPSGCCVVSCVPPEAPATLTAPTSDADGVYDVSWTASAGATSYQLESSAPDAGTTIYPLWVQVYSGTAITYKENVGGGNWHYRVKATNACGESAWKTLDSCVVAECLKSTDPNYAGWKTWRYPGCWCYQYQCRGDINGKKNLGLRVQALDLAILAAGFNKSDAALATVPNGICADTTHKKNLGLRVQALDLAELAKYFNKADALVPSCTAGNYNYWKLP